MKRITTYLSIAAAVAILFTCGCGGSDTNQESLNANSTSSSDTTQAIDDADFVLTNGKVYTVNEKQPWAEAVVVKGKEIVYVGDNAGAKDFIGDGTEEIDLKGRLLLPGLVESHIHIGMGAGTTSGLILESTDSLEDVLKKVKEYAEANPDKKTIFGASYSVYLR